MFATFLIPLGRKYPLDITWFFNKWCNIAVWKAFINICFHYKLYQNKPDVIMRPQGDLRSFIQPLLFAIEFHKVFTSLLNFKGHYSEN